MKSTKDELSKEQQIELRQMTIQLKALNKRIRSYEEIFSKVGDKIKKLESELGRKII